MWHWHAITRRRPSQITGTLAVVGRQRLACSSFMQPEWKSTTRDGKNGHHRKNKKAAPSGTAFGDLHQRSHGQPAFAVAPRVSSGPGTVFTEFCALLTPAQVWAVSAGLFHDSTCIRCCRKPQPRGAPFRGGVTISELPDPRNGITPDYSVNF